jgi:hypothetical protein
MRRERLLRDPTAAADLLRYALRHDDPTARAVALAHLGPDPTRWADILALLPLLPPADAPYLERALAAWPDEARVLEGDWARHLGGLRFTRALTLSGHGVCALENLLAVATHPDAVHLTRLSVAYRGIGDAGVAALAKSPMLANLTHLDLRYCGIQTPGARALARSPHLTRLRALHLQRNDLDAAAVQALCEAAFTPHLTYLDLRYNPVGGAGAEALASCAALSGLVTLLINDDDIDFDLDDKADGIVRRTLAASPHLRRDLRSYWTHR